MVCTTTQPQDAVTHQIWDFYLKEYGRYAADSIQILETKSDVKVNAKMKKDGTQHSNNIRDMLQTWLF